MATKTLQLEGFKKGHFISWFITSQAANKITIKLYDEKTTYVNKSKQSIYIDPPIAEGHATLLGENLKLEITAEPNSSEILTWFNNMNISSATTGKSVGEYFVLAGEDQKGGDEDYNDICVSIVGWYTKN